MGELIDQPVHVLMDESGNGNPGLPLIVGAVVVGAEFESVDAELEALYRRWVAQEARFKDLKNFEEFKARGFHGTQMPPEVQMAFVEFMRSRLDFKVFMITSDRSRMADVSETQRLIVLYTLLLSDVILRFRNHSEIAIRVEDNEDLRPFLGQIASGALRRARAKSSSSVSAEVTIAMVPKRYPLALAIIDFHMLTASNWLQKGGPTSGASFEYRNLVALEPAISLLKSFERGVLSNRTRRITRLIRSSQGGGALTMCAGSYALLAMRFYGRTSTRYGGS